MNETRLTRVATGLYGLSILSLIGLPIILMVSAFSPDILGFSIARFTDVPRPDWGANIWAGVIIGLIPFVFAMFALEGMRRLFTLSRRGDPLAPRVGPQIRRIGLNLLLSAGLGVALVPVQSALMSMSNPQGERFVSVSVSTSDIGFILVAGLLILIGWSMAEAQKIAVENKEFI